MEEYIIFARVLNDKIMVKIKTPFLYQGKSF